jgi:outer membrane lipoprotein-sorting protein
MGNPPGGTPTPLLAIEEMLMRSLHKTVATLATSLFVIASGAVVSAEGLETPEEIMDSATAKMSAYKTWSADYSQDVNMLGRPVSMSGQVVQKPPHRVWMQLTMPLMGQQTQMTMVMGQDGIMWQIVQIGSQRQIMKMDVSKIGGEAMAAAGVKGNPLDQFDPRKQLETTREMFEFHLVDGRQLDGQPMYVLDGTWKPAALTNEQMAAAAAVVGKTRIFIGRTDGFVHRLEQYDKSTTNQVVAMEFKNLKFNQDVPDAMFVYHPPADAQVMDLTSTGGVRMKLQPRSESRAAPESAPEPQSPTRPAPGAK